MARARQVARQDQRIRQRRVHQRAEPRGALGGGLLVAGDGLVETPLARPHVADDLACRSVDLGRIHARVLQCERGELLRALQLAGVVEGDREVAVGLAEQVAVAALQGHVQGLARGAGALAELALLGQFDRLAAIGIAVQLHGVALVQRRAFGREGQRGIGILQATERRQRGAVVVADGSGRVRGYDG